MSLIFNNIRHDYGAVGALARINLTAKPGQITCLLGESGCGKTTLLHLAAGLLDLQEGDIQLDSTSMASPGHCPPPEKRPVGLVFQDGALFPHLTVSQNIAFGLPKSAEARSVVTDLLDQTGLSGLGPRYPHTLSGGQRQRVALARALAPEPRVLLLDEPFANVDIVRRRQLRQEIRTILKARETITLLVTHDPEEAMEMADHIAIMAAGRIVQQGTARDLYTAPATATVGMMMGGGTLLPASLSDGVITTPFGPWSSEALATPSVQDLTHILVRPTAVVLSTSGAHATLIDSHWAGPVRRLTVRAKDDTLLVVETTDHAIFTPAQPVGVVPVEGQVLGFAGAD